MIALAPILAARKAEIAADEQIMLLRPEGHPRADWRSKNPIERISMAVADAAFRSKPTRYIKSDTTAALEVYVWSETGKIVERIDLTASDAQDRLDRYAEV